jgi:hypothetical protein
MAITTEYLPAKRRRRKGTYDINCKHPPQFWRKSKLTDGQYRTFAIL